ncbi:MAG: hypothetical protein WA981_01970 [Glaciecola sp.]
MSINPLFTRYSFIGFASYIVVTVIASILVMSYWVTGQNHAELSQTALAELASQDQFVQIASMVIGAVATFVIALLITKHSKQKRYQSALGFAICLTSYGLFSIALHPEHELYRQVLKVVMPGVLCFLAAKLVLRS